MEKGVLSANEFREMNHKPDTDRVKTLSGWRLYAVAFLVVAVVPPALRIVHALGDRVCRLISEL